MFAVSATEREQRALKLTAGTAKKSMAEVTERASAEHQKKPKSHRNTRSEKRGSDSPGEEEIPEK